VRRHVSPAIRPRRRERPSLGQPVRKVIAQDLGNIVARGKNILAPVLRRLGPDRQGPRPRVEAEIFSA